jgi:hypothetical protein
MPPPSIPPTGGRPGSPPLGGVRGGQIFNTTSPRNLIQHPFDVGIYLTVGKADHPQTVPCEPFGAGLVVGLLLGFSVAVTVNLDR